MTLIINNHDVEKVLTMEATIAAHEKRFSNLRSYIKELEDEAAENSGVPSAVDLEFLKIVAKIYPFDD